jgi:hypothetical protein
VVRRTLIVACALMVAACGGGSGSSSGVQGPPSAQAVAESSSDFSGVALWRNKEFEVATVTYNLPLTAGPAAASKVNSRIR